MRSTERALRHRCAPIRWKPRPTWGARPFASPATERVPECGLIGLFHRETNMTQTRVCTLGGALLLALVWYVTPAPAADAPKWRPVAAELARDVGLCGLVVDHQTGCVWINVNGKG